MARPLGKIWPPWPIFGIDLNFAYAKWAWTHMGTGLNFAYVHVIVSQALYLVT